MSLPNYLDIIRKIEDAEIVSLDTETLSIADKTLVSFSICCDDIPFFIPVQMNTMDNYRDTEWKAILKTVLNKEGVIFHNFAFDSRVLYKVGYVYNKNPHDTMIISHLLNENISHRLKDLVKQHLNYEMVQIKQLIGTGKKQITFAEVDERSATNYGSDDALYTYKLFKKLYSLLQQNDDLLSCYENIERPLLLVVADMHSQGVPVDINRVQTIQAYCQERADEYYDKLQFYMHGVNLNSPLQLRQYFIDKKYMPILKRSKRTGEPSVDSEVLEKYKSKCVEAEYILQYRYYTKILTTFVPALTPQPDGKIYPEFNQVGTTSGRFSSSEPNFQNIPTDDTLGLRNCIVAPPDYVFIGADYSQLELRLTAHFSQDPTLLHIYRTGGDIHQQTATSVKCNRKNAKIINFGIIYGIGVRALAKNINSTMDEAYRYMKEYNKTYPGVREFMSKARYEAVRTGKVTMYGGRKRNISRNFEHKSEWERGGELRSMCNAIIQGSGAMIIKQAMVNMHPLLQQYGARIVAQIHDELIIMCPTKHREIVKEIVRDEMIKPTNKLLVPFEVDVKIGKTWGDVH